MVSAIESCSPQYTASMRAACDFQGGLYEDLRRKVSICMRTR